MAEVVALVDYGAGNLHSVENALRKVGAQVSVTADPDVLRTADRIVLPGVGSFKACAEGLRAQDSAIERPCWPKSRSAGRAWQREGMSARRSSITSCRSNGRGATSDGTSKAPVCRVTTQSRWLSGSKASLVTLRSSAASLV